MGFFSWKTQDTDRSIANNYSSRSTFPVHMLDDKGNVWSETDYEGYGIFGGKDYYELLAEMNGLISDREGEDYTSYMRSEGIDLAFGEDAEVIKYPNLVEMVDGWKYDSIGPESCPDQGYFYSDEEEDDVWGDDPEEKYWNAVTTWNERHSNTDEDLW